MRVTVGEDITLPAPRFVGADGETVTAPESLTLTVSGLVGGDLPSPTVTLDPPAATLTAADHTAGLDRLTLTWSAIVEGQARRRTVMAEVVGGHYAELPDLRAHPDLTGTDIPAGALRSARDAFARMVAEYRGASWVRCVDVLDPCQRIVDLVDLVEVDTGRGQVVVRGLDEPLPPQLHEACLEYVRSSCLAPSSGIARNALSWGDGQGGTYRTSTADWSAGRPTGLMEVDRRLNELPDHRIPLAR